MRHKFMSKRGKGMIHRKELERIRNVLIDRKNDLENELTTLPEGSLYCAKIKGCWYYYQLLPKQGNRKKEKRLGISNDTDKIFALVRKQYINKALALVEKDIKVLEMAIKHYVDIDEESVMEKFLEKHPELSAGIMHGHQRDEEWAEAYDRQEDFFAEERKRQEQEEEEARSRREQERIKRIRAREEKKNIRFVPEGMVLPKETEADASDARSAEPRMKMPEYNGTISIHRNNKEAVKVSAAGSKTDFDFDFSSGDDFDI